MFNRTNLLTYISKFLVIVFLNVCRVKCETQCPLNFCTTFSIAVIKLLMWSLNYWRGYWTVVWSLNYTGVVLELLCGHWTAGGVIELLCGHWTTGVVIDQLGGHWTGCLFWAVHTKPTPKTERKKKGIRYQTINEENTEHPLPLYWSTYTG